MTRRLAYLGPTGTYTEQAALNYDPDATLVSCASIPAVADEVISRRADEGVVPIENSLEGSVTFTLDVLIHESSLFIKHEIVVPIRHTLVVNPGTTLEENPRRTGTWRKKLTPASARSSRSWMTAKRRSLSVPITAISIGGAGAATAAAKKRC